MYHKLDVASKNSHFGSHVDLVTVVSQDTAEMVVLKGPIDSNGPALDIGNLEPFGLLWQVVRGSNDDLVSDLTLVNDSKEMLKM